MQSFYRLLLLSLCYLAAQSVALVTLNTIQELTNLTNECVHEIRKLALYQGATLKQEQMKSRMTAGDPEEVEDTVAAALKTVDNRLLEILNMQLDGTAMLELRSKSKTSAQVECDHVRHDYDTFLSSTVWLLREVEFRQTDFRWGGHSPVFQNLAYLQALWASRSTNEQSRSFIEQQLQLYKSTECFEKINEQVLKRDIEVVEYMNDLLDTF